VTFFTRAVILAIFCIVLLQCHVHM